MSKFLSVALALLIVLFMPLLVLAQDVEQVFEIEEIVHNLFGAGGWPLVLAAVFSLAMAVLVGRIKIGGMVVRVPFVTGWLKNKISKEWWPLTIILVAGMIGLSTSLIAEVVTLPSVIQGFISGLVTGAISIGIHQTQRKTVQGVRKIK